ARFPGSKDLSLLPRRVFGLQKFFRCCAGGFSRLKSSFVTSPARFQRSKVFSLLFRHGFGLQKHFFHSVHTKIIIQ
ncbi:MAG: hypothetical protein K2J14_03710, partial [Treponemataceae bacterium]|nr:hypothetical protein [Treponemataceae bacterium]